jgi:hypothetical protein
MFDIPTLNISVVLFYVIPIGIRFSLFLLYRYLAFVCLCHTYRNSVFVIPTLNILDVVSLLLYLQCNIAAVLPSRPAPKCRENAYTDTFLTHTFLTHTYTNKDWTPPRLREHCSAHHSHSWLPVAKTWTAGNWPEAFVEKRTATDI